MLNTVLAYLLWGFFPAFFPLLLPASPLEIIAHRVIWTAVLMVLVILINGAWRELRDASAKTWGYLALAGVLITANWGIYVLAVNTDHVADAALGYFINPLLSVLLATLVLRETLRKRQVRAIAVAGVGVVVLIFLAGQPPVMALGMALTFAFYGLIKKQITVSATASVAAETLVVAPAGVAYLIWLSGRDESTFLTEGPTHAGMLMLAGVVTALPLLFYGSGAKQLPLTTIGMLQYITPTMQMLWALFVTQEYLSPARWLGYIIIWIAVAIYLSDLLAQRRERRSAAAG
ncbi:RarD protein [Corynebacterium maris DSM 45190]|uniref:RarD protein n=1 Tax=Corynebacterium maris DSM 45190 TaxID=1224163 RepID=S5TJZ0_9CORY|nr:EamA family transporter RarD [Corynebacterium maris]AGS35211.1 RarD protein [Corynebacterium maris DSM 45190]